MHIDKKRVVVVILLALVVVAFCFVRNDDESVGYQVPTDLATYGITGKEKVYTFISLTQSEEIEEYMALLDENTKVIDFPAKYFVEYRISNWEPYTFAFTMCDGALVTCKISMIDEPSRIIEKDGNYRELVVNGEIFAQ